MNLRNALLTVSAAFAIAQAAVTIDADDVNIQYSGRMDFSNPKAVRFEWVGCYIAASFQGTSLGVLLTDGANDYNVFIDGQPRPVLVTTSATSYTVASGLSNTTHTVLITKRTESYGTIVTFRGFVLDDGKALVAPAAKPSRKLLFIGDSFSAGLTNESDDVDCDGRSKSNNYLAFTAYAACSLQAEYHVLARSGTGLCRNYGYPAQIDPNAWPVNYGRTFPSSAGTIWDSTRWAPDGVVICHGLNDFTSDPNPTQAQWEGALLGLINRTRVAYPGTKIIVVGERFDPQITYSRNVVQAERTAGRLDVFYCNFTNTTNYVCGHPNITEHRRIAGQVVRAIRPALGWDQASAVGVSVRSHAAAPAIPMCVVPPGSRVAAGSTLCDLKGRPVAARGQRSSGAVLVARP